MESRRGRLLARSYTKSSETTPVAKLTSERAKCRKSWPKRPSGTRDIGRRSRERSTLARWFPLPDPLSLGGEFLPGYSTIKPETNRVVKKISVSTQCRKVHGKRCIESRAMSSQSRGRSTGRNRIAAAGRLNPWAESELWGKKQLWPLDIGGSEG